MAYDGDELREELERHRTKSVIPNRPNRRHPFSFSKRLYKLRWRIESAFNRLKDFRRIATRYDKLERNYLASVCLAVLSHVRARGAIETPAMSGADWKPRLTTCRSPAVQRTTWLVSS